MKVIKVCPAWNGNKAHSSICVFLLKESNPLTPHHRPKAHVLLTLDRRGLLGCIVRTTLTLIHHRGEEEEEEEKEEEEEEKKEEEEEEEKKKKKKEEEEEHKYKKKTRRRGKH